MSAVCVCFVLDKLDVLFCVDMLDVLFYVDMLDVLFHVYVLDVFMTLLPVPVRTVLVCSFCSFCLSRVLVCRCLIIHEVL